MSTQKDSKPAWEGRSRQENRKKWLSQELTTIQTITTEIHQALESYKDKEAIKPLKERWQQADLFISTYDPTVREKTEKFIDDLLDLLPSASDGSDTEVETEGVEAMTGVLTAGDTSGSEAATETIASAGASGQSEIKQTST